MSIGPTDDLRLAFKVTCPEMGDSKQYIKAGPFQTKTGQKSLQLSLPEVSTGTTKVALSS